MALRDGWQRILIETFAPEFGFEVAAHLASLPLRERREKIREWYRALPPNPPFLALESRIITPQRQCDRLRMITVDH